MKLVSGVGYNDRKYPAKVNGKPTREYNAWLAMLYRGCSARGKEKYPTYKDCKVCDEWLEFSNFYEWIINQPNYGLWEKGGFHLDKDTLCKGNKEYSPQKCRLVPQEINKLFLAHNARRGECSQGVYFNKYKNRFQAQCKQNGITSYIGCYDTESQAYTAYKAYKKTVIIETAIKHKEQMTDDTFQALLNWEL